MATTNDVLLDAFGRVDEGVRGLLSSVPADEFNVRPDGHGNPIGWLVWHLTRVQDGHITELLGGQEVWETGSWARRFGLDNDPKNTGYGHTPAQVAEVRAESADALTGYYDAVRARTTQFLADIEPAGLDRVVDTRWDPPVTLGVRLVSIADDCIQHVGQAAYVRGLLEHG